MEKGGGTSAIGEYGGRNPEEVATMAWEDMAMGKTIHACGKYTWAWAWTYAHEDIWLHELRGLGWYEIIIHMHGWNKLRHAYDCMGLCMGWGGPGCARI